jgi:hypothetical protein
MTDDVHLDTPVNALASFHYYQDMDMAEIASWGLSLIGDSGAYSADAQGITIDPDDFYAWADRWQSHLLWTAALDVIGDPDRTWANWRAAPPHLDLVPTIHFGSPPDSLDRYAEQGATLIGLGGMVPKRSQHKTLLRWCLSMFRHARQHHPHIRFHGWGVTHPILVDSLPWYSVDSSGFTAAYRYGRLSLFDPTTNQRHVVWLNNGDAAKHARLLRQHYGVNWQDLLESSVANRRTLTRVAIRTNQLIERRLKQRHNVTPPARLTGNGTRIHVAPSPYDTPHCAATNGLNIHSVLSGMPRMTRHPTTLALSPPPGRETPPYLEEATT